ncbi:hypothetical protein K474DRAFT_1775067 [Panus rudis PR-1116 ss-1]|nr:hypothetical protein K474DRAFT_1775067 [Panus rudis PR-1116 ss-1]
MAQTSLDIVFIISIWLEALLYALLCISLTIRRPRDLHTRVMFIVGVIMFLIATMHLGMNCYRLLCGYINHGGEPGGAVTYLSNLSSWSHIFKDTLYATQELFGDAVAIYRCYIIWNHEWKVVVFPIMVFVVSAVSGYTVCGTYATVDPNDTVFNPRLKQWITIFFAIAVVQSALTTGLIAFRIWHVDRHSARYRMAESSLMPVVWILVESASLQLLGEVILLILYLAHSNAQYILLEIVTPLVGITFTAMIIRITIRLRDRDSRQTYNTSIKFNPPLSRRHSRRPVESYVPTSSIVEEAAMDSVVVRFAKGVEVQNDRRWQQHE